MRLLRTDRDDLQLKQTESRFTEPYAILSHTWSDDEVVFADIGKDNVNQAKIRSKQGYRKLFFALAQARHDKYDYLWADTCCIDKSSSAELSEAINSMFQYYQRAAVCYVFLSDVRTWSDFKSSRWFTRGWTLQELLAPGDVQFFSNHWELIGNKTTLQPLITETTGIPGRILSKKDELASESVARRMSWASSRQTTRIEDAAYCLLGIFGINMPLLYGEEEKAFIRLQEEITKVTDDQTLFAWRDPDAPDGKMCGLLAESPRFFSNSAHYVPCVDLESEEPYSMVNKRLKIEVRFMDKAGKRAGHWLSLRTAVLSCLDARQPDRLLSISLRSSSANRNEYRRIVCSKLGSDVYQPILTSIYVPQIAPGYYAMSNGRPEDYIVATGTLSLEFRASAELFGCTYQTRPDPKKHRLGNYTTRYPKCAGHEMPRQFVGESFSNRMAAALHYNCSKGLTGPTQHVTVLFGMTRDLEFGYNAILGGADASLDSLHDNFFPQTQRTMLLPYAGEISREKITGGAEQIQIKVKCDVTRSMHGDSSLTCYNVNLKFGFS